ncbi:Methyltransferase FkbM [Paracoccaceae bacterium]
MIEVRLPTDLEHSLCEDLIRLGRDHDGGYLVSRTDVLAAECMVSLGLNEDWSFEADFTTRNDCPLFAYDASVGAWVFLKRLIRALRHPSRRRAIVRRLNVLIEYLRFFRGHHLHLRSFVAEKPGPRTVTFDDVAARVGKRRFFLKVDIEGAEYGILDSIIALSGQLSGLVIEFHDCHRRLDRIRLFVRQIGLTLIHAHANNYGPTSEAGIPSVIELTFSASTAKRRGSVGQPLPHVLDQPNKAGTPELAVRFTDPDSLPVFSR